MTDYPMCHVCYYTADQCMCSLNLKPGDTLMSDNVTPIRPTVKPADPVHIDLRFNPGYPMDTLLAKTSAADLKGVLLVGYKPDGSVYIDTNIQDGPLALWAMEVAKTKLMKGSIE